MAVAVAGAPVLLVAHVLQMVPDPQVEAVAVAGVVWEATLTPGEQVVLEALVHIPGFQLHLNPHILFLWPLEGKLKLIGMRNNFGVHYDR